MTKKLLTSVERDSFLDKFDNFLFDCDGKCCTSHRFNDDMALTWIAGVLWDGSHSIPGVDKAMEELRKRGMYVTILQQQILNMDD